MRNPWRLLLLRSFSRPSIHSSRFEYQQFQVRKLDLLDIRHFSSFVFRNTHQDIVSFAFRSEIKRHRNRCFSSEPAFEHKDPDHVALADIFSKSSSFKELKNELESNNLTINHDLVLTVLQNFEGSPEVAKRFFDWVSETANEKLSSKSYNLMLGILGRKDHVKDFWDLLEIMKKKGYGISKGAYIKASENFEKENVVSDLDKLREIFLLKSAENSVERMSSRFCKIIRQTEWTEDVEKKLGDSNVSLSGDLVTMVLENLSVYPIKAFMFFRWAEENPSFRHSEQTYNAMVRVLGREDCIERFWVVANEMKGAGYEMEMHTYFKVLDRFYKRKMIKEAADLYEFMTVGANKPSVQDCVFLLRKILVSKDIDMDLISRVVRIFMEGGNAFPKSTIDGLLRSLTSVGRLGECNKILKAMKEGGFLASGSVHNELLFRLSTAGKLDEASEILDEMETTGYYPDTKSWSSLIQGHCVSGALDNACSCFRKMVEKNGVADASYAFDILVNGFCHKNRAEDACKFLSEMVNERELQPKHSTYKILIQKLLVQGNLKEALSLLEPMRNHGFPPFLCPFISYISKCGSGDDAMSFLKAMTVKKFPSTSVFLSMFEAFFEAGRHNEAHDFLSKCPRYIRSHADVLNLFCSMKPEETAPAPAVVA